MKFSPYYTSRALADLDDLDKKTSQRILDKVDFFCVQSNPLRYAKKLVNFSLGNYRFRVGDYRIIFDLDDKGNIIILVILAIRHRREAYNI